MMKNEPLAFLNISHISLGPHIIAYDNVNSLKGENTTLRNLRIFYICSNLLRMLHNSNKQNIFFVNILISKVQLLCCKLYLQMYVHYIFKYLQPWISNDFTYLRRSIWFSLIYISFKIISRILYLPLYFS